MTAKTASVLLADSDDTEPLSALERLVDALIARRAAASPELSGAKFGFMVRRDVVNEQLDFEVEQQALELVALRVDHSKREKG
jgi:hypothetical protein